MGQRYLEAGVLCAVSHRPLCRYARDDPVCTFALVVTSRRDPANVLTMDKAQRVASIIAKLVGNAQPVFCE